MKELTLYEKICRLKNMESKRTEELILGDTERIDMYWERSYRLQSIITKQLYIIQAKTEFKNLI